MRTHYTKEFKQNIVYCYENGTAARELCFQYGLPKSIVYDWINRLRKRKSIEGVAYTYEEILKAQKRLNAEKRKLDIIKKSRCFPDFPRKTKLKAIEALFGQYPVKTMCSVLDVDHSTFYNYHFRRVEKTQYALRDEFLMPKISEIFEQSKQRFGARKMLAKLKEQKIRTCEQKVRQIMKDMNLVPELVKKRAFYPKADTSTTGFCSKIA